ncbi:hypothetical protein BT93_C1916 [Corymbia citriodora subsp. variegata]|nr:hypothetical protein BT93_C1916 [Corymbia citriodora subsp. variegata]KAF8036056.1 hypothetical protein BT93_C1916 [Corymbia citriodora subsp. variegata]KAF8036057.1 hypothetical protein BT93_C1916 [Corymbia citriodora subsp. variegata]KAF8036059.1 hypothetical protein BT93_C1916 [Corymbia citriodora subsp. variegata]
MSDSSAQPQPKQQKQGEEWLGSRFRPQNYIPGLVIGFILGWFVDLTKPAKNSVRRRNLLPGKHKEVSLVSSGGEQELKMVLVIRQDLKMGPGKVASQCAHAAMGMYAELMQSNQFILRQWEQRGQPKIVYTCKNQQEMNQLREAAESTGLPTFAVTDAGRTQVCICTFLLMACLRTFLNNLLHDGNCKNSDRRGSC